MSNDAWLHAFRGEPDPGFAEHLRARLRAQDAAPLDSTPANDAGASSDRRRSNEPRARWSRRALIAAAAVVAVAVMISVPAVRASVAEFVSLFRVDQVVAVPVDARRLDTLRTEHLDLESLIGEQVQVVKDPGPPVVVGSLTEAAATAGMSLALPQWLPDHTQVMEMRVAGERIARVTANTARLQQVLDALGITDVSVPVGLDGQVVTVDVPPVVMIRYDHGKRRSRLFEARSPQVTLPASIDIQALGEIGLRILGFSAVDAKQFAQALDWHTTLIVPVPPNATSFRQVEISGRRGVLIQHQPPGESPTTTIVWSTPQRVFALVTLLGGDDALMMANSVR